MAPNDASDNNPEPENWFQEHRLQTALLAASGATLLFPGLMAAPVLAVLGWGSAGVRAGMYLDKLTLLGKWTVDVGIGSIAAGIHASIGNVVAGGAFATLQSAGMGGYGTAAVHGAVQVGAAAVIRVVGALRAGRGARAEPGEGDDDEEGREDGEDGGGDDEGYEKMLPKKEEDGDEKPF